MIDLFLSDDSFINDIHPLVRSFFPGEEIKADYSPDRPEGRYHLRILRDPEELISFEIPDESAKDRLKMKNVLKCRLYEELVNITGKSLPWGTLSGIRPSRLAMNRLESGASYDETVRWMEDFYLVSPEKSALAVSIASKELRILKDLRDPSFFSLYIGIPFCPTTCLYCSFPSNAISLWKNKVGEYLSCVEKELDAIRELFGDRPLVTLYIGGGTPTTLGENELKRLINAVFSRFNLSSLKEFTVEAGRPDSIDRGKLKVLKEAGVDRISVNPQTMKQETLDIIGRNHSVEDTVRAFYLCREEGFDNINMDLILGLPGETEEDVAHTISCVSELGPDDLTIHSLALKRGSRLLERIEEYGEQCPENTDSVMKIAEAGARAMGLEPYYLYRQKNMSGNFENTGWAHPGKEGLYNILMMEEIHSIPAAGAGTISKCVSGPKDIKRTGNVKDVKTYLERIDDMIMRKRGLFGSH